MVCVGKAPVSQGQLFMYNTLVEILNFAFFINLIIPPTSTEYYVKGLGQIRW